MNEELPPRRPRYLTSGGILIGEVSKRPMAICDEEEVETPAETIYLYNDPEILGFPRRQGVWNVAPVIAPYSGVLSSAWSGTIPDDGCQFYLVETYEEEIVTDGVSYLISGIPQNPSAVIVQAAYDFDGPGALEIPSTWGGGAAPGGPVSIAWSLALVGSINGQYHMCIEFANTRPPNSTQNLSPYAGFTPIDPLDFTTLPI